MPTPLKTVIITLFIEGALALAVAAALVFGGLYDVAATAQHLRPTAWLLHTTMRHSVARQAAEVGDPPRFNEAMLVRGAAHFRYGCAPCHGAPGAAPSAIERSAEPPPPPYSVFANWSPRELFWIVKNGVKMTAMPGWPAQDRDDEVWDMVAFLVAAPTTSPETFARLAFGKSNDVGQDDNPLSTLNAGTAPPPSAAAGCAPCHGTDGHGRNNAFPNIGGLSPQYIASALRDFRGGGRASGYMQRAAAGLSDNDIKQLADYFGAKSRGGTKHTSVLSATSLGARIAKHGTGNGRVPACVSCHALDSRDRTPGLPALTGQPHEYLDKQLALFASGVRKGSADERIMAKIARAMSTEERSAVVDYFASLGEPERASRD
ncbi:MAG TPA: c-type cytochrome [Alphaproteobacteria bacterium]|jgi:cytochrome c553|nr:c-type cytochrome [Alphaproteobacteria bacterium]